MSGTSLDGLDIVCVSFLEGPNGDYDFEVHCSETIPYSNDFALRLSNCSQLNAEAFCLIDRELSLYFAESVNEFILRNNINRSSITAVASHGQTIFHQPDKGLTVQIGNHCSAALRSELTWVCDFRVQDVALGGNGAPLVPIGDALLFKDKAAAFLNLGGFSNISFEHNNNWIAFDISPMNLVFNYFARKNGKTYDRGGELGRKGKLNNSLFEALNDLEYYKQDSPKSLGIEWLDKHFFSSLTNFENENDIITTCYHHVAFQTAKTLNEYELNSVFVTGGGAKNSYFIESLESYYNGQIIIPENQIIEFKEAIIFAFLGLLKLQGKPNVLASVTGALNDHSAGIVYNQF